MNFNGVYMKKVSRPKRAKTVTEELDEVDTGIGEAKEALTDLKRDVSELEKQLNDIGKKLDIERKKELAKELDQYR